MRVFDWGRSMYGGWFVNYFTASGKYTGEHFNTYGSLATWAEENGIALSKIARNDNI